MYQKKNGLVICMHLCIVYRAGYVLCVYVWASRQWHVSRRDRKDDGLAFCARARTEKGSIRHGH